MNTGSTAAAIRQSSPSSLDGVGAGDHDLPYRFGRRPRASAPYPFSTRQYARLLVLRGRVREALGPGPAQPRAAAGLAVRDRRAQKRGSP